MEIDKIIDELKSKRKVFFSESDFQFALAWEIQRHYAKKNIEADIRLEYCFQDKDDNKNKYIDIIVKLENTIYPIELKYKTLSFLNEKTKSRTVKDYNEYYNLKNQGAQDLGRYDYLKDIQRIEQFSKNKDYEKDFECGYAILLTNDISYWDNDKANCVDVQFSLKDNRTTPKKMSWENAGKGTTKGRENPIELNNKYTIKWNEYSKFKEIKNGEFKYCLNVIK
jgi:hypothetical protein